MGEVLPFPLGVRAEQSNRTLMDAICILRGYLGQRGRGAKEVLQRLLVLPEVSCRLGQGSDQCVPILSAGNALDQIAAILDGHYFEGGAAEVACNKLLVLFNRPSVVAICQAAANAPMPLAFYRRR